MNREYKLTIEPGILQLLGPNLYTNIYYVWAELIANAYDADAENVYIILEDNCIRIEDDGHGMSYKGGEIKKYLKVASESRTTESESKTRDKERKKMGRKGLGKLSALAVSENVDVLTIAKGEKSGFVLSRHIGEDGQLAEIPDKDIKFRYIDKKGSAIVMHDPQYQPHKTLDVIERNVLKLFPLVNTDFRIHLIRGQETKIIEKFDEGIIRGARGLAALVTLGEKFKPLCDLFSTDYPEKRDHLLEARNHEKRTVNMKAKDGEKRDYSLEISGWIGAYKTTSERKKHISDFPDNFISLFANGKIGEFNILPAVGQNKLNESYIVGQLHVDLFELTELPDMALSSRQGYKSEDPRYIAVQKYVREKLLPNILGKRRKYTDFKNKKKNDDKETEKRKKEESFNKAVIQFREITKTEIADKLRKLGVKVSREKAEAIISESINDNSPQLGLKCEVDANKKKILISHTADAVEDKTLADVIHQMLLFNHVPPEDILYTSCEDEVCRIPERLPVYKYLRKFVESYSDQKIYVLFVTSENMAKSWGALVEVGASWITQIDHKIFNIAPFKPKQPLDNLATWHETNIGTSGKSDLYMSPVNADIFCEKIEAVCDALGFPTKERTKNKEKLKTLISVR